ncbi:MAG: HepT-like ribonuclease domain-containing protein [Planctomycetota bacterium]|jgi:uncharacterized protein with HEPN domain
MSFEPREYLRHILIEAEYLLGQSGSIGEAEFLKNETLQRAFVRSLEVIGEAAKKVPADVRAAHPGIDWRGMAGMRDRLIHGYFGVDYDLVWDVIQTRIPALAQELGRVLGDRDDS